MLGPTGHWHPHVMVYLAGYEALLGTQHRQNHLPSIGDDERGNTVCCGCYSCRRQAGRKGSDEVGTRHRACFPSARAAEYVRMTQKHRVGSHWVIMPKLGPSLACGIREETGQDVLTGSSAAMVLVGPQGPGLPRYRIEAVKSPNRLRV